ncbi:MAG TPA: MerR family transcriptional regulator [Pilimelia sp.]|nr:MerR family transcriptional regulator [Pilimelia sp.]
MAEQRSATDTGYDLTVSQVAAAARVSASAIRFYETHGLIESRRTPGNQRRFGHDAACRVRVIRVCQRVGLSVAEIRDLLRLLPRDRGATAADWTTLSARLEAEVRARMDNLRDVLRELSSDTLLCDLPTADPRSGRYRAR